MWLSNPSIWSFTWCSLISLTCTRPIFRHMMYTDTESIVEYCSVSCAVSRTILRTGTLRLAIVWFWNCSMRSITWRTQICHTTGTGCCRRRCLIILPNIAKSSENVRNHDFGSVSVRFRVANERENRRPGKNAYRCTRLFNVFFHVVPSDFSHDHGNMSWLPAFGNPVKSREKFQKRAGMLENFTIKHH